MRLLNFPEQPVAVVIADKVIVRWKWYRRREQPVLDGLPTDRAPRRKTNCLLGQQRVLPIEKLNNQRVSQDIFVK